MNAWHQADMTNWEALANRACSAKQGWVENKPGICSAGGPPPICPRTDHWHVDTRGAAEAWRSEQQKERLRREQELIDATCGCWRNALISPVTSNQTPSIRASKTSAVPCEGSCEALPGYVCRQGFCVLDTFGPAKDAAKDYLAGKVLDKAKDVAKDAVTELVSDMNARIGALLTSTSFKVFGSAAGAFLSSVPTVDWGTPYRRAALNVQQQLGQLQNDLRQYELTPPSSEQSLQAVTITRERDELEKQLGLMNTFASGLITERGLGPDACYGVIEYQNAALNASFGILLSRLPYCSNCSLKP